MRGEPQTIDLLVDARDLLKRNLWRQGPVDIHHRHYCALTALLSVASECKPTNVRPYTLAKVALATVVAANQIMRDGTLPRGPAANVIIDFNDDPKRTKADVLWLYDMAMLLSTGDFSFRNFTPTRLGQFAAWVEDVRAVEIGRAPGHNVSGQTGCPCPQCKERGVS